MILTHFVFFSFLAGASASDSQAETPSGGWRPGPLSRRPRLRQREQTDEEIKADRIRMGIIPPDPAPDLQPDAPGLSTSLSTEGGAIEAPFSLAAHLLPEDLAGLEALAARAAELTMDEEIAMWLRLDQQRRLNAERLRDEDDAAVLLLAIATIH